MNENKSIHFGHFVRWKRLEIGGELKTVAGFAAAVDMSDKQVLTMEKSYATPDRLHDGNLAEIARALGMTRDALNQAWRTTPVPSPNFRKARGAANRRPLPLSKTARENIEAAAK